MDQRLLTIPNVCAYLHLSRTSVYRMINRGEMPGVLHIGGVVRIDKDELDKWIQATKQAQSNEPYAYDGKG